MSPHAAHATHAYRSVLEAPRAASLRRPTLPASAPRALSCPAPLDAEPDIARLATPTIAAAIATTTAALQAGESVGGVWAYVTLGLSSILTEELSPIVGGVAASQGELGPIRVFVAITVGGWVATAALYALGWWRGRWVRERFPRTRRPMVLMLRAVRRRPWRAALMVRWAFGARVLLPITCGAAHLRLGTYLVGTAVSSVLWSATFVTLGYALGEAALGALAAVRRYDQWVAVALVALVAIGWTVMRWRAARRVEAAAASADPADEGEPPR